MGYWGKILGGFAGFAMGGPFGAVVGATLGHAADSSGAVPRGRFNPAQLAALFGRKEQLFSISVVVLSAKLAKCDGPVTREEIDAFKRQFRIPPSQLRDVGRLFDEARDRADGYEQYAAQLGQAFADSKITLTGALGALFAIARADGPINKAELMFLSRVHAAFGLDQAAWDEARGGPSNRMAVTKAPDAYAVLGVGRNASDAEIRNAWKKLVRENHPDSLAARGVPADFVALATEKVAEINAAWDSVKRERHL